jgi:hypothetical protein
MNCQEFENLVLDLARANLLDAAMHEQSLVHTRVCERCAARLAEERALFAGVRTVVAALSAEEAPARLEKVLLDAFRTQSLSPAPPTFVSMPGMNQSSKRWAAVAAGILVLLSVMIIGWRSATSDKHQDNDQTIVPAPTDTADPQVTPKISVQSQDDPKETAANPQGNQRKRKLRGANREKTDETEVFTIFFILKEGEDLTALENLSLVRVELPGSAINEVGIPVVLQPPNSRIKADVVLGQDGLARAIRFVR